MNALSRGFVNHRIACSRGLAAGVLLVAIFGSPQRLYPGWMAELSEMLGYGLLAAAALWRIWCALFIAGTKNGELATAGPYSVVRNPLYLGNFLGAIGFGFAVEQPLVAVVLGVFFALLYPAVVEREEQDLQRLFGDRFRDYAARVPRWIPDWSLYREPEAVTVPLRHVRKAILDAMWFLWAFALWEFIEALHSLNLLPTWF